MKRDPYKYFRIEAAELLEGLTVGLLQLEKGQDVQLVTELFRLAHTFKGASRVVKRPDLADIAHAIEDLVLPHRQTGGPIEQEALDQALELLRDMRSLVATLGAPEALPSPEEGQKNQPRSPPLREGVSVAVGDLDYVLETALETHSRAIATSHKLDELDRAIETLKRFIRASLDENGTEAHEARIGETISTIARIHRSLDEDNDRLTSELSSLKEAATKMRLVPAKSLFADLEQIAREAARIAEKKLRFDAKIETTHLDARIETGLRQALIHIIQNGIAHGLESSRERVSAGKAAEGLISVSIRRVGSRLLVTCADDGRGFDLDAIRAAFVREGALSIEEAESRSPEELFALAATDGFSTSANVSGVSGRGVGLGAARAAVQAIRGHISLETIPGQGTSILIDVPVTLAVAEALSIYSGDVSALVPLEAVAQALRIDRGRVEQGDESQQLLVDGTLVPYVSLAEVLELPERESSKAKKSAVILRARGRTLALGVDRIGGAQGYVVHDLPRHARARSVILGAVLTEHGAPSILLAPLALLDRGARKTETRILQLAPTRKLPILVVDDSLTTRMLERSILEGAGYEVDLATSGQEGLEKARTREYGAFIVDVEMPFMNGFELLGHLKSDPNLRDIPAILVTSLDSDEHKRRGKEAGAYAYMVKSNFDQERLLGILRRFV